MNGSFPSDGIQRNPYLRKSRLGVRPNPSEYLTFRNVHQGAGYAGATVHIDYIEDHRPLCDRVAAGIPSACLS